MVVERRMMTINEWNVNKIICWDVNIDDDDDDTQQGWIMFVVVDETVEYTHISTLIAKHTQEHNDDDNAERREAACVVVCHCFTFWARVLFSVDPKDIQKITVQYVEM